MEDLGLDARALNIREGLRSWHEAGLRLVFKADFPAAKAAEDARAARAVAAPAPAPKQGAHVSHETPAAPKRRPPQRPQKVNPRQQPAQPSAPKKTAPPPAGPQFPWEEFRPKLHTPSRTVWTYWDLGDDFGENPSAERRKLFAAIIKNLHWPAGSITFWPVSAQHRGFLLPHPGSFWRGVREAEAQTVFCFGERAFQALFPGQDFTPGIRQKNGMNVYVLPGPNAMLAGDKQAKLVAWNGLKSFTPS